MAGCLNSKARVAVVGASGYTGGELLRILAGHPHVEVTWVVGHQAAGQTVGEVHPALRGVLPELSQKVVGSFEGDFLPCLSRQALPSSPLSSLDVLFLALPHGEASRIMGALVNQLESMNPLHNASGRPPLVIDLSGDFRLTDPEVHSRAYGFAHGGEQIQQKFVYGLPELHKTQITQSRLIANPGCFATACALGLAPLVADNLISGKVVMDCVTGSTGAGTKPSKSTHHPERAESYFAYKPFVHQHLPEIEQTLKALQPEWSGRLVLQTHSGPFTRGIYGTIHAELANSSLAPAVAKAFESFYREVPLVRLGTTPPQLKWVKGSSFVDISYQVSGPDVLVTVALDNLVKGAAGQAVQNMNLAMGWSETSGLSHLGLVG